MAAFPYQHYPYFLDNVFMPNNTTPNKMSGFMEEGNMNSNCFSQFYLPELPLHNTPLDVKYQESSCDDHSSKVALSDNETSVTKKQSTESSVVVDKLESGEQVSQKVTPMGKKRKNGNGSCPNSAQSKDAGEVTNKKARKGSASEEEKKMKPKAEKKDPKKVPEEPPTGYIHVRARRGQATDSHSLAERVRREKISERMKILQRLVPGCDKVTGKALMLDEIINYVQSLQNQVEFLSMKLASVNPMFYDFGVDLDAFMVRPERLSSMLPLQQCSPTTATAFVDNATTTNTTTAATATNFVTDNNYPLLDDSASFLLQQEQRPNAYSQDNGSLLWDVDDQRRKFLNPSAAFGNNLCSFH